MGQLKDAIDAINFINPGEYVFIETGTYNGDSTKVAYDYGFKKIYTIELIKENYDISKNNLEKYSDRINLYHGDSKKILPEILKEVDSEKIVFWLDAHVDHPDKAPHLDPCPLHIELSYINKHKRKDHIIMIDDMRIINTHTWGSNISKNLITQQLKLINKEYNFIFVDSEAAKNDILIALNIK